MQTFVLVEGVSDRVALETLARRRGRDLGAEGISIVPIGGAQAVGRAVQAYARAGITLAGLCDVSEERRFRRALDAVYVCVQDLEDELIRALGVPAVERVVEAEGELGSFRTLQKQPEWRGRPANAQLRRFISSHSGRKERYARLLVEALDLASVPRPLDGVLAHV